MSTRSLGLGASGPKLVRCLSSVCGPSCELSVKRPSKIALGSSVFRLIWRSSSVWVELLEVGLIVDKSY